MVSKLCTWFLVLNLLSLAAFAQSKGPEYGYGRHLSKSAVIQKAFELKSTHPDSALQALAELLNQTPQSKNRDLATIHFYRGKLLASQGKHQEALHEFDLVEQLFAPLPPALEAEVLRNKGTSCIRMGQRDASYPALEKSYTLSASIADTVGMLHSLEALTELFMNMLEPRMAIRRSLEMVNLAKNFADSARYGRALLNHAVALSAIDQDSAAVFLLQSIPLLAKNVNNQLGIYYNLVQWAKMKPDRIDEALDYALKGLNLAKTNNMAAQEALFLFAAADVYHIMLNYPKAIAYFEKARQKSAEIQDAALHIRILSVYRHVLRRVGEKEAALELYDQLELLSDSMRDATFQKQLADAEEKYQNQQMQLQLVEMENDRLKRSRRQTIWVVSSSILLLTFGSLAWLYAWRNQKNQQLFATEKALMAEKQSATEIQLKLAAAELKRKEEALMAFTRSKLEQRQFIDKVEAQMQAAFENQPDPVIHQKMEQLMHARLLSEADWDDFKQLFEQVHQGFLTNLRMSHPQLSAAEIRLAALLKLKLDNKEIASMLGISTGSVYKSRYRLKKQLNLPEQVDLEDWVDQVALLS